jgi:hypothetical protein
MPAPRSTRGASRGVLECGSGAVVSEGCNTHTRAETAEAARSRCARWRVTGTHGGGVVRRLPSARRRRWSPSGGEASAPEREGSLKSNGHRGSRSIRLKHRARDAGEMADLRSYRLRLSAARRSGPRVRQDPGVPRRPHGAEATGAARAPLTKRAAERWLYETRSPDEAKRNPGPARVADPALRFAPCGLQDGKGFPT